MVREQTRLAVLLTVLAWLLPATPATAIDINGSQIRWGFNGKVAPNRFNLLSVLVENPTPEPFEGPIRLQKQMGDARLVEVVSLAPFTSRWVQFYPYIHQGSEEWTLSFERQSIDVPMPRPAKFQRVIIEDPTALANRGTGALRPMPENLFPAFVAAMDALQVVALDREPRTWIPAQKQAFLDWLSLGGIAIVLHGPNGKFPEFSGPLTVLNAPLETSSLNAGQILRIGLKRSEFTVDEARRTLGSIPRNHLMPNEKAEDPLDVVDGTPEVETQVYGYGDPLNASSFLTELKDMTRPNHNWLLLHFMFWIYIGLIFPGCYLVSRRWSDFRIVYAALAGIVVLFSVLFSIVGQRGYGEATAVHSAAIARALPDGSLDVANWSNVFVTSGADYVLKYNSAGMLVSTCSETERVNGVIDNGVDGSFKVDIPPFSNREFATRVKLPSGAPRLTLEKIVSDSSGVSELAFAVEGITQSEFNYALVGNRFYSLQWNGPRLVLGNLVGDASSLINLDAMTHLGGNRWYGEPQPVDEKYRALALPLLARSLNLSRSSELAHVSVPANIVRVFVYATMPVEFAIQNERLKSQVGRVLYCVDVPTAE